MGGSKNKKGKQQKGRSVRTKKDDSLLLAAAENRITSDISESVAASPDSDPVILKEQHKDSDPPTASEHALSLFEIEQANKVSREHVVDSKATIETTQETTTECGAGHDEGGYWKESEVKKFFEARRVKLGDTAAGKLQLATYRILTPTETSAFNATIKAKPTATGNGDLPIAEAQPVEVTWHQQQDSGDADGDDLLNRHPSTAGFSADFNVSLLNFNVNLRGAHPTSVESVGKSFSSWLRSLVGHVFNLLSRKVVMVASLCVAAVLWLLGTLPLLVITTILAKAKTVFKTTEQKVSARLDRISRKIKNQIASKLHGSAHRK